MNRNRRAKIVATLGPTSDRQEQIEELFVAGADVFRFNFSHGSHAEHKARMDAVRAIETKHDRPISVLADLQGPKLRIGQMADGGINLEEGQAFRLDLDDAIGDQNRAPLPHPEIFAALKENTQILLNDGKIRLRATQVGDDYADTVVEAGGHLTDRKGVNVPNAVLPVAAMTDKDRADLTFALTLGVDWVALSFVQRPEDVAEARKIIQGRAAVLSKLEKPAAIDRLDEIITLSDAVMVARGDLGVELPPEDVPGLQKQIIRRCREAGKPVVVATQMLESMISAPAPTRAEASDVATAVYDGADAVMLSAETASGDYPLEAVSIMDRIIARTERDEAYRAIMDTTHPDPERTAPDAITAAARQVAETIGAAAIVTYTTSGSTTLRAARERPDVPILCLTESRATARRLVLVWGIHGVVTQDVRNFGDMIDKACRIARDENLAKKGERLVVTAGVPFGTPGATNILRIAWVGD
ncbi:MAG: pyruvate kinase [Alphaproteobacteria bacterium]